MSSQNILFVNIRALHGAWPEGAPRMPLAGAALTSWPVLYNAWMWVKNGRIAAVGTGTPPPEAESAQREDLKNAIVIPGFCDSHTHAVFPAWRTEEYADKLAGLSYSEIAARGGGILNSARKVASMSEDELYQLALVRVQEMILMGTTALEIKSGYGLEPEHELKMLRVIQRLVRHLPIPVQATCLAAHAVPLQYKSNKALFIQRICEELLPAVASEGLATFVDVFCEKDFFTPEESHQILEKALSLGFKIKVHAHQLGRSGGVEVGTRLHAHSVDHLEYLHEEDIEAIRQSGTIATVLPIAAWFLNLPYPPVRQMLEKEVPMAIATDFNPGSAPSCSMWLALALACTAMKMQPTEAFAAATINGAFAMDVGHMCGSLSPGYRADFIAIHDVSSLPEIVYRFHFQMKYDIYILGARITY
ncbi:MAG: imidazolonepropionase [Flavobacteriales bacterium]|nr:imidazolonepropionase [Flavobacteriales bacterium]